MQDSSHGQTWNNPDNQPRAAAKPPRKETMTFKEIRALSGLKRTEFSRKYGIPQRTLENWETDGPNRRDPAEWILRMIERVVREDAEENSRGGNE